MFEWNVLLWQVKHDERANVLRSCLFVNEKFTCITDKLYPGVHYEPDSDFRSTHPFDLQAIEIDTEVLLGAILVMATY